MVVVVVEGGLKGDTGRFVCVRAGVRALDDSITLVVGHVGRRNGSNTTKTKRQKQVSQLHVVSSCHFFRFGATRNIVMIKNHNYSFPSLP